jgi:hypothetical protein
MYANDTFTLTFFLQYVASYLGFVLTNSPYVPHGVNIAVQALFFFLAYEYLIKETGSLKPLALLLAYPAYYHYAIFGLRDPFICLIALAFILAISARSQTVRAASIPAILVLSIATRPEFTVILIFFLGLYLFLRVSPFFKTLLILLALICVFLGSSLVVSALGVSSGGSFSDNIDKVIQFNELRNERRVGSGGGDSAILGGKLYELPLYLRYPVQIAATFLAPLPHEIRGLLSLFGFFESILFCAVVFYAALLRKRSEMGSYFFLCGLIYLLIIAFFTMNYGNVLRVRYPAYIFFIASISYALSDLPSTFIRVPANRKGEMNPPQLL